MNLTPILPCTRCRSRQAAPDSNLCPRCLDRTRKPTQDGYQQKRTDGKLDPAFVAWFKMEVERLNRK